MDKNLKAVFKLVKNVESENGIVQVGQGLGPMVIKPVIMGRVIQYRDVTKSKEDE